MDQTTLARVNLCGVLRALEQLPELDPQSRALLAGAHEIIQFSAPRVGVVRLALHDGEISHHLGAGPNTIHLFFPGPTAVNKMFAGTGNPIPVKGFSKLGFLKGPFTTLTERLTHFLMPTPALLADADYRRANSLLTLHLAVYALAEIGNWDPIGRLNARRMADGDIQLQVTGGPALVLNAHGGRLKVVAGESKRRRATMRFSDVESAGQVLRGELASYTAIGNKQIELGGYVPLLDNMNKLLGMVPRYLG